MSAPLVRADLGAGPPLDDVLRGLAGDVRVVLLHASDWSVVGPEHLAGGEVVPVRLGSADLVSVAAVEGPAVGPGAHLALAVDLLVMGASASLALPEVQAGSVPAAGTTARLAEALGWRRALEVCATGRQVPAQEAAATGLAVAVAPDGEAETVAGRLVAGLLAAPRDAVVEAKALLRGARARTPAQQCEAEQEAVQRLRGTPD